MARRKTAEQVNMQKQLQSRLRHAGMFFGICFSAVLVSLLQLQLFDREENSVRAQDQRLVEYRLQAKRGSILATDGLPLAQNVTLNLIYAVPPDIPNKAEAARLLAPILDISEIELNQSFARESRYVPLRNWQTDEVADEVRSLRIPGIVILPEEKRTYPEGNLLSHVLGYVNRDGQGTYGLEGYYDGLLTGQDGFVQREQDVNRRIIPIGENYVDEVEHGATLLLTIDRGIQRMVEQYLKAGVEQYSASSGTIIVMDPADGAVVAMASYPDYDPNNYVSALYDEAGNYVPDRLSIYTNPAVSLPYEPGSVFKVLTVASGLDSGLISSNQLIYDSGEKVFDFGDGNVTVIRNWDELGRGSLSLSQCLEYSNNICMGEIANAMGPEIFRSYIRGYGFGDFLNVDLDYEAPGIVRDRWDEVLLYTHGFGQGLSTTPLQMVSAVSAIANRGELAEPHLVQEIIKEGELLEQGSARRRQIISRESAEQVTQYMLNVVDRSEGTGARVPGYRIAGKTGTAQIASPRGGYYSDRVVSSFVGFAPAEAPKFIMLVKFDLTPLTPQDMRWGSQTAAPTFAQVASELFRYYEIPPVGI